jgi:hypothetical protein
MSQENMPNIEPKKENTLSTEQFEYIQTKSETNDFFKSLLNQYNQKGSLSDRQIGCIVKAMNENRPRIVPEIVESKKVFTLNKGDKVEIKTWIAKKYAAELNMEFFLRNLEVVEVLHETTNAYQVKVKFLSMIASSCHLCGRPLDNEISRLTGIGPSCAKKLGLSRPNINEAHKTITELEHLCSQIGVIGPLWLPKSQIK